MPTPPKSARTRAALLDAAEDLFAAQGFAATRLQDVAREVGIRRASIAYHFPDKRALYEAVLARALGVLRERVETALAAPGPFRARVEAAVGAWADTLVERPALARLVLREMVDAGSGSGTLRDQTPPFAALFDKALAEARREPGWEAADRIDPLQVVSVVVGATVFFAGALPALAPPGTVGPAEGAAHRRALQDLVRRLLPAAGGDGGA